MNIEDINKLIDKEANSAAAKCNHESYKGMQRIRKVLNQAEEAGNAKGAAHGINDAKRT